MGALGVLSLPARWLPGLRRTVAISGWLVVSLVLGALFRIPPLVNAAAINSDAAIVGLETRHFLRGEWALHLWGTTYQTATESFLLLPFFALGGSRPVLVFLVPLLGMLLMIGIVQRLLRRHLPSASAFACTLPLIFATQAINSPMTFIMRQAMVTLVMFGVLLLDGAHAAKNAERRYFLGGLVFAAGILVDTFALILFPAGLLFVLLAAADGLVDDDGLRASLRRHRLVFRRRLAHALAGFGVAVVTAVAIGQLAFFRPRPHAAAIAGAATTTAAAVTPPAPFLDRAVDHLRHNFDIFADCAPFALGARSWIPGPAIPTPEWSMPLVLRIVFGLGATVFALLLLSAIPLGFGRGIGRGIGLGTGGGLPTWEVRRLGLFGIGCGLTAVAAFLLTGAPKDVWSTRYLAPLIWFAPLALAPIASQLSPRRLFALLAPWATGALVCGWVAYGAFVDGPRVRLDPRGAAVAEREVMTKLRERSVHEGYAQYWLAYRLSLLFEEDPLIVPANPKDDRHPPLRAQVDQAKRVALVFHPSVPHSVPDADRQRAIAAGTLEDEFRVEDFTVLVVRK